MRGSYENHPGFGTNCICQMKINPHPTGMSSRGYACRYTGGHCLPNDECSDRVKEFESDMKKDVKKETECCQHCEDGICNGICSFCFGSGEGQYDESTCTFCEGSGSEMNYCDCAKGDERLAEEVF